MTKNKRPKPLKEFKQKRGAKRRILLWFSRLEVLSPCRLLCVEAPFLLLLLKSLFLFTSLYPPLSLSLSFQNSPFVISIRRGMSLIPITQFMVSSIDCWLCFCFNFLCFDCLSFYYKSIVMC